MHTDATINETILKNMTHEQLASLKYRIESIQKNRHTRLNEIIKNKDTLSLKKYIKEIPLSPKDISTYHLSQHYSIEDMDFITTLLTSLRNVNEHPEIQKSLLIKYESDSYGDLTFNGIFFEGFKNLDNYRKIKNTFPEYFHIFLDDIFNQKNTSLNRCKDELFTNLSVDIFEQLIEDKILLLNDVTIKYVLSHNSTLMNFINKNYNEFITDDIKINIILKNYKNIETYYNDNYFKPLFNSELVNKLFLINHEHRNANQLIFLENHFNINKDIISEYYKEDIDQATITELCKGNASFFKYILNDFNVNNDNINNFIKPIIKNYKNSSERSKEVAIHFYNKIKDDETLLSIFKRKAFVAKNSNPEFFEFFNVIFKTMDLDKSLVKKETKNSIRKMKV